MQRIRTHEEVDRLVELARTYYAERAAYRDAAREGRLSPDEDAEFVRRLEGMDERIECLKSNSEVERARADKVSNIIPMAHFRKAAR